LMSWLLTTQCIDEGEGSKLIFDCG
jgi:hypothetical protein